MAELEENAAPEPQFCVLIENGAAATDVVVRLSGDLDIAGAPEARAVVDRALESGPRRLTFDVSDLRFMDSSGIAVLVAAAQKVDAVTLRNPSPVIERLLTLAGLAEVFHISS